MKVFNEIPAECSGKIAAVLATTGQSVEFGQPLFRVTPNAVIVVGVCTSATRVDDVMYQRILVANRGEIALRIIRACRELGVETVAIYSEGDRGAQYLQLANEAYCVGPAKAADSYLKIASVISAAEVGNVQAIHPGYGFLAENAHFNEICRSCNIDFIGPSPQAMARLGDKNAARALAREANVPVVPGSDGIISSEKEALELRPFGRLSGADQGGRRRRRARNARGVERSGAEERAAAGAGRGGSGLRQRRRLSRKIHRAAAARRSAGARRSCTATRCISGSAIAASSAGTKS